MNLMQLFTSCNYLPVLTAILAIWWALDLFCFHHLVALSYSGSHQSVSDKITTSTPPGSTVTAGGDIWGFIP